MRTCTHACLRKALLLGREALDRVSELLGRRQRIEQQRYPQLVLVLHRTKKGEISLVKYQSNPPDLQDDAALRVERVRRADLAWPMNMNINAASATS